MEIQWYCSLISSVDVLVFSNAKLRKKNKRFDQDRSKPEIDRLLLSIHSTLELYKVMNRLSEQARNLMELGMFAAYLDV